MNTRDIDILLLRTDRIATRLAASAHDRREDLQQEAALGVLEAMNRKGFDPERGSWSGFVAAAGFTRAADLSWRIGAPVSCGAKGDLKNLSLTSREPVFSAGGRAEVRPEVERAGFQDTDTDAHELAALLHSVIARGRHADAVSEVLLRERSVREVAGEHKKCPLELRRAVAETKQAIKSDKRIREFVRAA